MRGSFSLGFAAATAISLSALGQQRVTPFCSTWQTPEIIQAGTIEYDNIFVPMIVVEDRVFHTGWGSPQWRCVNTPELAAEHVAYSIAEALAATGSAKWINNDGSNVVIMLRYVGNEGALANEACTEGIEEDLSFFVEADDTIPLYPFDGPDFKHPFLRNGGVACHALRPLRVRTPKP